MVPGGSHAWCSGCLRRPSLAGRAGRPDSAAQPPRSRGTGRDRDRPAPERNCCRRCYRRRGPRAQCDGSPVHGAALRGGTIDRRRAGPGVRAEPWSDDRCSRSARACRLRAAGPRRDRPASSDGRDHPARPRAHRGDLGADRERGHGAARPNDRRRTDLSRRVPPTRSRAPGEACAPDRRDARVKAAAGLTRCTDNQGCPALFWLYAGRPPHVPSGLSWTQPTKWPSSTSANPGRARPAGPPGAAVVPPPGRAP